MRTPLFGRYVGSIVRLAAKALPVAGLALAVLVFGSQTGPVARSFGTAHGAPVKQGTVDGSQPPEDWPDMGPRRRLHRNQPRRQGPVDVTANRWTNLYPQLN